MPREPSVIPPAEVDAQDPSVRERALDSRGAAVQRAPRWSGRVGAMVSLARRVASVVSVVGLVAGSLFGGREAHRWITTTPRFGAREIAVNGNVRTLRDQILTAATIQYGTNVLGVDTARAEHAIEQLPWISRAHVTRRLPGSVAIDVEERHPSAVVSAGGLYLCTDDGTLFKRVQPGDPDDFPVITGIDRADFESDPDGARENVRDALALLADLGASSLGTRVHVEELHRDRTGDLSIVLAESQAYVWLGRGPYRAKLSRLSAILAELDRQQIRPAEIHLESDRHPERASVRVPVPTAPEPTPTAAPSAGGAVRSLSLHEIHAATAAVAASDAPTITRHHHRSRHH